MEELDNVVEGEFSCFGKERPYGVEKPRKSMTPCSRGRSGRRPLRYKRGVLYSGLGLVVLSFAGAIVCRYTSGSLSRAGLGAAIVPWIAIVGFLVNPLTEPMKRRSKRSAIYKLRVVK